MAGTSAVPIVLSGSHAAVVLPADFVFPIPPSGRRNCRFLGNVYRLILLILRSSFCVYSPSCHRDVMEFVYVFEFTSAQSMFLFGRGILDLVLFFLRLLLAHIFVVIGGRGDAGDFFSMSIKYSGDTRNIVRNYTMYYLAVEI